MKSLRLYLFFTLCLCGSIAFSQSGEDIRQIQSQEWQKDEIDGKIKLRRFQGQLFDSPQNIVMLTFSLKDYDLAIVQPHERIPTSKQAQQYEASAAINGSFFNMKTGEATTFLRLNASSICDTTFLDASRINGIIAINEKHTCLCSIDSIQSENFLDTYPNILAAGPLLVLDGELELNNDKGSFATARHPRSCIGLSGDSISFIVVDGRHPEKASGMSIKELQFLAFHLGLNDALNLDGGGSSTLWTAKHGVISCPSDNKLFDHEGERAVSNVLLILEK